MISTRPDATPVAWIVVCFISSTLEMPSEILTFRSEIPSVASNACLTAGIADSLIVPSAWKNMVSLSEGETGTATGCSVGASASAATAAVSGTWVSSSTDLTILNLDFWVTLK
uniref:Uncharacterized protein n=1 Tax=Opuntia streptacantha TaxID=393608 RepID=A0A7C8Z192_OPUST